MSFIAKLKLDEEEMNVLECEFRFSRSIDSTGKPITFPQGGVIKFSVESSENTNLFSWLTSAVEKKSGTITFYRRDTMSKLKELEFKDAFCIDYYEKYDHVSENPMRIQATISAREIRLNYVTFLNNWPK